MNGWTKNNELLRQCILQSCKSNIFSLNETHLKNHDQICLPGYTWVGLNRKFLHNKAPKRSGGVGFFIEENLYDIFNINLIDNSYDGILGIQLKHKLSNINVVIFSCYLPPEYSKYGRN